MLSRPSIKFNALTDSPTTVAPLYISEISPPETRGALLVLEELSIVTGIVPLRGPSTEELKFNRHRHRLLDYIWNALYGRRVVLATPIPSPADTRVYLGGWNLDAAILPSMVGIQGS